MARDEALRYRLLDRCREIHVLNAIKPGARIEYSRLEARIGQLHEGMAFTNGDRFRHRNDTSHKLSSGLAGERQRCFDFRVAGKVFGVWEIESAARRVESIRSLLRALQSVGDLVNVAQVKARGIDEHAPAFFSSDLETPKRRIRERIFHSETFVGDV